MAQALREIGARTHTTYRHARVWLWRFRRSPERQDRAAMLATFALIGAFTVGSVDAIVTGGADFGPGSAYAMEYQPVRVAAVVESALPPSEAPPPVESAVADSANYSFTNEELLGGPEIAGDTRLALEITPASPQKPKTAF